MQIVFIYGKPISSALTKFFTGSSCYHVGFTDGVKFWDMNKIRRRRVWEGLYPPERVILCDAPSNVTAEYLESMLETDDSEYGTMDYLLLAFRWLAHALGLRIKNAWGAICSEMVASDCIVRGWRPKADWVEWGEVPSPADLELAILGRKDAIKAI